MRYWGIVLCFILSAMALAQPQIDVSTDRQDYANGDIIQISGTVREGGTPYADKFVSLEIRDSRDEVKYVSTKTTNSSGEFADSLVLAKADTKTVYSLTVSVENARQTVTFKYGGGPGSAPETRWMYWALGGLAAVVLVLLLVVAFLVSRQGKREVKHMTREARIAQLAGQIEDIEGKYGITERSARLRKRLDDMKRGRGNV